MIRRGSESCALVPERLWAGKRRRRVVEDALLQVRYRVPTAQTPFPRGSVAKVFGEAASSY